MKLPSFSAARLCVVGDVMLDRYWHGDTDRVSPEAPVPVVKISHVEERVGGAGNVAANVRSLGASVTLISCVGQDDGAEHLRQLLSSDHIQHRLIGMPDSPTITKLRVVGRAQQLIRLDFERAFREATPALLQAFEECLPQIDVVVLSDYAKGVLAEPQAFIQAARAHHKPVVVDPKQNDWECYRGATILTPNLKEFQQAVGKLCSQDHEIEQEARFWIQKIDLQALLVTRGASGMSLIAKGQKALHIPAMAKEVYDVTGAGDTVIAVLAATLAVHHSFAEAAHWANRAAGIVVGKLGTATLTPAELSEEKTGFDSKIVSEKTLLSHLLAARRAGRRIVMTNGCFDILHPGHIQYLEQAKALGDILVVALNDDASVSRLKGPSRPIHSLAHRLQVLAGLQSVDFVIPFTEDTPQRLIATIMPDVLCKGGDYEISAIAGSQEVLANGGQVKILPFVEGCSTTNTVQKILQELSL